MRLGVDLSNLSVGGGLTHISSVLKRIPSLTRFGEIVVFGKPDLERVLGEAARRVRFVPEGMLSGNVWRAWSVNDYPGYVWNAMVMDYWRDHVLPKRLVEHSIDVLFAPGCILPKIIPGRVKSVTMCRNMLPFQKEELRRLGVGLQRVKFCLLRKRHLRSFRQANGLIYVSEYAKRVVTALNGGIMAKSEVIPHGVEDCFRRKPRYREKLHPPIKLLYVSSIVEWKHQWKVIEAVRYVLERTESDVQLDLVGWVHKKARRLVEESVRRFAMERYVRVWGPVPQEKLVSMYHNADIFIFASTCENCPNILLEAMASGLPIACSLREPMTEFPEDAAIYFEPEEPTSIAEAIVKLVTQYDVRNHIAEKAFRLSHKYDWDVATKQTFDFLESVAETGM